jgi:hypothetical protein
MKLLELPVPEVLEEQESRLKPDLLVSQGEREALVVFYILEELLEIIL